MKSKKFRPAIRNLILSLTVFRRHAFSSAGGRFRPVSFLKLAMKESGNNQGSKVKESSSKSVGKSRATSRAKTDKLAEIRQTKVDGPTHFKS